MGGSVQAEFDYIHRSRGESSVACMLEVVDRPWLRWVGQRSCTRNALRHSSLLQHLTSLALLSVQAPHVDALILLARWLGMRVYNGLDKLVDNLAAGLVANLVNLLDLGICVLLRVLFSLLVA